MKQKTEVAAEPAATADPNMIITTLQGIRKGSKVIEASEKLAKLVKACEDTGRKGEMTMKISLVPNGDAASMKVKCTIDVKAPKEDEKPSIFFTGENGELMREHPKQPELALRVVEGGAKAEEPQVVQAAAAN